MRTFTLVLTFDDDDSRKCWMTSVNPQGNHSTYMSKGDLVRALKDFEHTVVQFLARKEQ